MSGNGPYESRGFAALACDDVLISTGVGTPYGGDVQIREWLGQWWATATNLWARVGPRTRDVVFMALSALLAVNQIIVPQSGPPGLITDRATCLVLAAIATISLWWRRTRPVLVTVVGLAVIAVTAIYAYVLVGLFSLAIRRRDRTLIILAALGCAGATVGTTQPDRFTAGSLVGAVVIVMLAVLAGAYVGVRRDLLSSLRDRVAQAEAERDLRATQARIGERSRIAREMHDVLAHKVSLIALHAGGLEVNSNAASDEVERIARTIGATARQALVDLRGVLGVLRADESPEGSDLAPQPSLRDVSALVESSRRAAVRVGLRMADGLAVPEVVGRTAYRVVQEALTNVHKHARGAKTLISIDGKEGAMVVVEVRNARPVGGDRLLPGAGAGLVGLRERVGLLRGEFASGATPEGGWLVRAAIPWPADSSSVDAQAVS